MTILKLYLNNSTALSSIIVISLHAAAERPSYNQLLNLKKADGSVLQVVKTLSSFELHQCEDFAYLLLCDDVQVRKLKSDCKENKDKFVRAVLKDWLSHDDGDSSDPAVPRILGKHSHSVSQKQN